MDGDNYESALATDAPQHGRQGLTEIVDDVAGSMPASSYLGAALGALALALACRTLGRSRWSSVIAQSVPVLLLFGAYRKLAKLETLRAGHGRGYTS